MTLPRTRTKGPFYREVTELGKAYQHIYACPNEYTLMNTHLYPSGKKREEVLCQDELHKGPPYRSGGPLFLKRIEVTYYDSENVDARRSNWRYTGRLAANISTDSLRAIYTGLMPSVGAYGAEAWNKFRPVKPKSDLGQWLGELRDLPQNPFHLKNNIVKFRDLGSQYLNYVFGWRPFIRDLIKTYETSKKLYNTLRYLRNHNNKWRKAGGTIKNESATTTENIGNISTPVLSTWLYLDSSYSKATLTKIVRDTVWFKARWKFHIPETDLYVKDPKDVWGSRLLRKLYGLELTPALAYELIPFTWLTDWFLNIGDFMANLSNSMYDNLVAKYAYVMRHRKFINIYDQTINMASTFPYPHCTSDPLNPNRWINTGSVQLEKALNVRAVVTAECKEREYASQWAFGGGGVLDESLSSRQTAILYALGLSRRAGAK